MSSAELEEGRALYEPPKVRGIRKLWKNDKEKAPTSKRSLRFDPELDKEPHLPDTTPIPLHMVATHPHPPHVHPHPSSDGAGHAGDEVPVVLPIHLQNSWNWSLRPSCASQLALPALPTVMAALAERRRQKAEVKLDNHGRRHAVLDHLHRSQAVMAAAMVGLE